MPFAQPGENRGGVGDPVGPDVSYIYPWHTAILVGTVYWELTALSFEHSAAMVQFPPFRHKIMVWSDSDIDLECELQDCIAILGLVVLAGHPK